MSSPRGSADSPCRSLIAKVKFFTLRVIKKHSTDSSDCFQKKVIIKFGIIKETIQLPHARGTHRANSGIEARRCFGVYESFAWL